jgi:hypothetical protein
MKLVKMLNTIEIDDEIKDTIMIASPITFNRSSLNTRSFINKATLFDLMLSLANHLLTPDHILELENNASSIFAPLVSMIINSFLAISFISADFNAQNILLKGSSHTHKPY